MKFYKYTWYRQDYETLQWIHIIGYGFNEDEAREYVIKNEYEYQYFENLDNFNRFAKIFEDYDMDYFFSVLFCFERRAEMYKVINPYLHDLNIKYHNLSEWFYDWKNFSKEPKIELLHD